MAFELNTNPTFEASRYIRIDATSLAVLDSINLSQAMNLPGPPSYLITRINVPEKHRGQGYGRKLLKLECESADEWGITLFIEPIPYSGSPMDTEALTCWYERAGFVPHGGILRRLPVKE